VSRGGAAFYHERRVTAEGERRRLREFTRALARSRRHAQHPTVAIEVADPARRTIDHEQLAVWCNSKVGDGDDRVVRTLGQYDRARFLQMRFRGSRRTVSTGGCRNGCKEYAVPEKRTCDQSLTGPSGFPGDPRFI
jgi:hypothetical protein